VRFTDINLFGVYVAPISLMMFVGWIVGIARRCALM
jgi:protein AaeX